MKMLLVDSFLMINPVLVAVLLDLMERGCNGMKEAKDVRLGERHWDGTKLTC
jgi:hypothetical protein